MKWILAVGAALAALSFTPAVAQSLSGARTEVVSYVVRYNDLDLTKATDLRKLDRRIALAINEACGTASDADPTGKNDIRRCRVDTRINLAAERARAIALSAKSGLAAAARER